MSFKREGDDPGQLGVLQKRRVADLLANYIPEDEALLLRSGRYACTVCAHRPVFDTLDVLTVHRAGKKHMGSKFGRGWRGGWAALSRHLRPLCPPSLLSSVPSIPSPQDSPAPLLARTRRIAHSALLKAAPYSSCCRRTGAEGSSPRAGVTQIGTSAAPTPLEPLQKAGDTVDTVDSSPAALLPGHRGERATAPGAGAILAAAEVSGAPPGTGNPESSRRSHPLSICLSLPSAGWIQDPSGKWVKDENAEFDSDEEEPPALLPA
ncbi:SCNM1 protein, partial [Alopecoenas beccarii]|nr:SCNM1 protein [Alopecoenas beccarii]